MTSDTTITYRPTGQYGLLTAFGAAAALFCAWALWRQFDWITLIFMIGCVYAALAFADQWAAHVAIDRQGFWLRTPLRRRRVEFRQLDSATEAGRLVRGIVVTYHPLSPNGLLDLDTLHSVTLPAVGDQKALLEVLQAKCPHRA
ncbi:MAG TPA: hypothetical protein DCL15_04840 [Chloroflexi bacterium]|nr:hypothetical protein [Chloroflexota bacterium]HHW88206.1 hypothetical protein [Chloroflexota bacterium]